MHGSADDGFAPIDWQPFVACLTLLSRARTSLDTNAGQQESTTTTRQISNDPWDAKRPRGTIVPLLVLVLVTLWGCASQPPSAPQREWAILRTHVSTEYYSVHGTTTAAIFDTIQRNGLFDSKAKPALGLTSAKWNMKWTGKETSPGRCSPDSMVIGLDLVVTLPRHEQPQELSPKINTSWNRFIDHVAAHEQRHVDIYLDGARATKARMEAVLATPRSCSELEKEIHRLWASQEAEIEKAQDQFHAEEEARIEKDRKPLQAQIDVNRARLTALSDGIHGFDEIIEDVKRLRETTRAEIDAVKSEMAKLGASPPSCSQPHLTSRVRALCQQYSRLIETDNAQVDRHNEGVTRRNELVGEHNQLIGVTNDLIEVLNWTR